MSAEQGKMIEKHGISFIFVFKIYWARVATCCIELI